jgi:hypothetical protein
MNSFENEQINFYDWNYIKIEMEIDPAQLRTFGDPSRAFVDTMHSPSHHNFATAPHSNVSQSNNSSNIIFTILLCGLGLLFLYIVFRIKKLEVSMQNMERRQQQMMQQGMRGWFQNEENMEYLEQCLFHRIQNTEIDRSKTCSTGTRGSEGRIKLQDVNENLKETNVFSSPPNPFSGLMQMCGVGNLFGDTGRGGILEVTIGVPNDLAKPQAFSDSNIVEIEEINPEEEKSEVTNGSQLCQEEKSEEKVEEIKIDEDIDEQPAQKKRGRPSKQPKVQ